jgi:hypothetical protein
MMLHQNTLAEIARVVARSGKPLDLETIRQRLNKVAANCKAELNTQHHSAAAADREAWGSEQLAVDVRELVRLALLSYPTEAERERLPAAALEKVNQSERTALDALAQALAGAFADAHAAHAAKVAEADARSIRKAKLGVTLIEQLDGFSETFTAWCAEAREPEFRGEVQAVLDKIRRRLAA